MQATELLIKTRKFAKDLQKTNYDDFEVFDAINDALRLLAQVSADNRLIYFRKNIAIEPDETVPDDYLKDSHCIDSTGFELLRVEADIPSEGEYSIVGDQFKTGATTGSFKLLYFYTPCGIYTGSDTVALPKSLIVPIAKTAAYILQSDDSNALSMAQYFMGVTTTSSESES